MNKKSDVKKSYKDLPKYEDYLIEKLKNKRHATLYLQEALSDFQSDGDTEVLMLSIRHIAQARGGIAELAKKAHLNEKTLYRTLSSSGNPRLDTFGKLFSVLGFQLRVVTV
ncbi:MAG TPA: transcriptional regulator [Gammaproteobacteria bacterium]|nr:transcriptional regulator [Gammaproteobacteria bacterium]